MSAISRKLGTHRIVLDLPHDIWVKLRDHFKGASDADKILRILELTTDRAEQMVANAIKKRDKHENKSTVRRWLGL